MKLRETRHCKEQNLQNVQARYTLLLNINSLDDAPAALLPALSGQRVFSALSIPSLGIRPIALNTLKRLADELYPCADEEGQRGFEQLNTLRLRLWTVLQQQRGKLSEKVAHLSIEKEKWIQVTRRLQAAEMQNMQKSRAYFDLYTRLNSLIKEGIMEETTRLRLYQLLDAHHMSFASLFVPEKPEHSDDRVADIKKRR